MAFAEKRGRTWRGRYLRPDGTYGSLPGFDTKNAALEAANDEESAVRKRTWTDPKRSQITLDDYWTEWIDAQDVSKSTGARYSSYYRNHLSPWKGAEEIGAITALQVDALKRKMRVAGRATATIDGVILLLGRMLSDAVYDNRLPSTPVRPKGRRGQREGDNAAKRKGIAISLSALLAICGRLPRPEALLALATAFTGMRWGEAAGMRRSFLFLYPADGEMPAYGWYVVDKKIGALHEGDKPEGPQDDDDDDSGTLWFGPPKDREERIIDLPIFLVELLLAYMATLPAAQDLLFPTTSGEGYRRSNFARALWRPACDGWPARSPRRGHPGLAEAPPIVATLRFHDLRHTHETWMSEDHIPRVARDARLGHVTPGIEGTYNHVTPEMKIQVMEALEKRWAAVSAWPHAWMGAPPS
jgi:integrase